MQLDFWRVANVTPPAGFTVAIMDEFSITRPEPATPTRDSGHQRSASRDARERPKSPKTSEQIPAERVDTPGEDETSHQVDELA